MAETVVEVFGGIDHLVNNAAIFGDMELAGLTDTAALERQFPAPKRVGSLAMSSRSTVETSRASDESALSRRGTLGPGVARLHH